MQKSLIKSLTFILLAFSKIAFADIEILSSPNPNSIWGAQYLQFHPLVGASGCRAGVEGVNTKGFRSYLEVIAPNSRLDDTFSSKSRATTLIHFENSGQEIPHYSHGEIQVIVAGQVKRFGLLKLSVHSNWGVRHGLAAKLDERASLTEALKRGSRLDLNLIKNRQVVESFSFSLRGSTLAISSVESRCRINTNL